MTDETSDETANGTADEATGPVADPVADPAADPAAAGDERARDPAAPGPVPAEIRLKPGGARLDLHYAHGRVASFSAEFLRVESPSAEVQGHGGDDKKTVPGKRAVTITDIQPVGHYAIRLIFSDGHDTGFYSWRWFAAMDRQGEAVWQAELDRLAAAGLSRDPGAS